LNKSSNNACQSSGNSYQEVIMLKELKVVVRKIKLYFLIDYIKEMALEMLKRIICIEASHLDSSRTKIILYYLMRSTQRSPVVMLVTR
jgi:hypothetical protein